MLVLKQDIDRQINSTDDTSADRVHKYIWIVKTVESDLSTIC